MPTSGFISSQLILAFTETTPQTNAKSCPRTDLFTCLILAIRKYASHDLSALQQDARHSVTKFETSTVVQIKPVRYMRMHKIRTGPRRQQRDKSPSTLRQILPLRQICMYVPWLQLVSIARCAE